MRIIFSFLFILLTGLFISSCSEEESNTSTLTAKGGKKYGGELRFMSSEKITDIFPSHTSVIYTTRINSQIFEPLLGIDPESFKVVSTIAESFKVSDDSKVYTFKIRKGVMFHKDDCFGGKTHELNAEDVKFSLDLACAGLEENQVSYLLVNRINGAQDFYDKSVAPTKGKGVSGIKIINDYTVEITLIEPLSGFESILTHSSLGIVSKEAFEKYGKDIGTHPVGTGPFALETFNDKTIVLKRNPQYWKSDDLGNQLPFLDKIILTYTKDKRSELLAFRNAEIDLVLELPVEEIDHILGTLKEAQAGENIPHKVDSQSSMSMFYIAMACESKEFSDVRVRKAFNLAVSREVIIDEWLEGEGWAAMNGFVPKMGDYPIEKVKGHKYNVARAKALLKEAGYADGKGFPSLDFYVNAKTGSSTHITCQAIASQLKENLNINLKIKLCSIEDREAAVQNGTAKIWRTGWIADYPDPENFLGLFYGGNISTSATMVNSFRFKSEKFDELYEKALIEIDLEKRTELLVQCDQLVIDESAVMPILTSDHIIMYNARVKSFKANPLEMLYFTDVFIKENKKVVKSVE